MSQTPEQDLTQKTSRFFIKRGLKQDYERIKKYEGELYYLTDTGQLANHKGVYRNKVDGGWFGDMRESKFDGTDGGEF